MDSVRRETAEALIAAAAERGYRVSSAMLAKWRAAGLLPRPASRPSGRGRGTVTVYPFGSTAQLLRLLIIRAEHLAAPADGRAERGRFNPDRALWRLWWEGWRVDPGKVREVLSDTLRTWEAALGELEWGLRGLLTPPGVGGGFREASA